LKDRKKKILLVCRGNTCRSPMAEAFLKKFLGGEEVEVKSAGLSALEGMEASRWAKEVMQEKGFDITHHRARNISEKDVEEADLILTMSLSQKKELLERFPSAEGKTFLITEIAFPEISKDIWEYERALERLEEEKKRLLNQRSELEVLQKRYKELKTELERVEREISLILTDMERELTPYVDTLRKLEEKIRKHEIPDPYGRGKDVYEKVATRLEETVKLLSQRLKETWLKDR